MAWRQAYSKYWQYPHNQPVIIDHLFSDPNVLVRAVTPAGSPFWKRAGWLVPLYADEVAGVEAIGIPEGIGRRLYFRWLKHLKFEVFQTPFQLLYSPLGYIPDIQIDIWEPEPTETEIREEATPNTRLFLLNEPSYTPSVINPDLWISTFNQRIPYERFEVGRFYSASTGEVTPDPEILKADDYQLIVRFTSRNQIPPNQYKVRIIF